MQLNSFFSPSLLIKIWDYKGLFILCGFFLVEIWCDSAHTILSATWWLFPWILLDLTKLLSLGCLRHHFSVFSRQSFSVRALALENGCALNSALEIHLPLAPAIGIIHHHTWHLVHFHVRPFAFVVSSLVLL